MRGRDGVKWLCDGSCIPAGERGVIASSYYVHVMEQDFNGVDLFY